MISGAGGEQDIGKCLSPYRGKYMFRGNSGRAPKETQETPREMGSVVTVRASAVESSV